MDTVFLSFEDENNHSVFMNLPIERLFGIVLTFSLFQIKFTQISNHILDIPSNFYLQKPTGKSLMPKFAQSFWKIASKILKLLFDRRSFSTIARDKWDIQN